MDRLDLSLLDSNLAKCKEVDSFISSAPDGIAEEFFDKFLRVLRADKPADVQDITDDELLEMLKRTDEVFRHLSFENFFDSHRFERIEAKKSVMTSNRRVL